MPKYFSKPFRGVKNQEIYPTEFQAGEECPPELEEAASELGVLTGKKTTGRQQAGEAVEQSQNEGE
ncbi:hypothetical protein [Vogesella sp. XCS3]|uniref:hypothetical protein n=1 Tax=Vogesella sp. XCS3 TaxID=2877939 RepID=UPI001D0A8F84|nr:hypothetical protein [Vogesella sp. XCS3]UDM17919.1 hypothetical protein LCH97_04445 [Vogesella sp. XCS3]